MDGRRPATPNIALSSKFLLTEVTTMNVLIVRLTRLRRWRVLAASQSQGRVGQGRLCSLTPSENVKVKLLSEVQRSATCQVKLGNVTKGQHGRPFLSLFGSVEESLGTGPSFSKERSSVAASRHLGE